MVVVAGEPCPEQLVADHFRAQTSSLLYNEYGPTEAAVWCTGGELRAGEPITVGPAIAGTGILVLDAAGAEVAPGELGEVHITGVGLAEGYLGDPAQTAERFIEHPAGRRYRTGDLGRLLPDGRLVVVGRTDHQIKVRGYRVEPGEVESVLQSHPEVAQAVVTEHRGRLVAFVVRRRRPRRLPPPFLTRLPLPNTPLSLSLSPAPPLPPSPSTRPTRPTRPTLPHSSCELTEEPMSDPISIRVKQVLVDLLDIDMDAEDVEDRSPLYSTPISLDSLTLLRLIAALEKAFSCEIDDEAVMTADLVDVGSLVDLVLGQLAAAGLVADPSLA
ncbi:AMP-binding protein [Catenulispora yoronensis]